MNRLRCGRSSDSDGGSLHTAGPGQLAGPRHSTAPDGARKGTRAGRGWTGLKAPDQDQDVQLGVRNVTFEGTGTIEIATIRYSPIKD
jgi:hypothetical protein